MNMDTVTYSISEYDPNWISRFDSIRRFLQEVFRDRSVRIEHVGSTSVRGMKAKPIIDVLVLVEKMDDFVLEKDRMVKAGYEMRENHIAPDTVLFFRLGSDGVKTENIHVCAKDSSSARQMLIMRDFFRTFPGKAKEYSDLKEKLARSFPDDYLAYRFAKASFLERMERESYEWSKEDGYQHD